jgi:hypothetical protein
MKIKKEFIGVRHGSKVGMVLIEEGKEELYKKLGLNIFEDEPNKTKKGTRNAKRSTDLSGEDDDK